MPSNRICYFTARLDARPGNPNQPRRQLIYLRALATLRGFDAYYGAFRYPLAEPLPGLPTHALVRGRVLVGLVEGLDGLLEDGLHPRPPLLPQPLRHPDHGTCSRMPDTRSVWGSMTTMASESLPSAFSRILCVTRWCMRVDLPMRVRAT